METRYIQGEITLTIASILAITLNSALGDCWVVAALASMVTQPRLTMRSIPQGQSFRAEWYAGCFCFRFWQFGTWEEVIIDDRLPVRPGGRPLFVHSSRHTEFWPALLEKAYAKYVSTYMYPAIYSTIYPFKHLLKKEGEDLI